MVRGTPSVCGRSGTVAGGRPPLRRVRTKRGPRWARGRDGDGSQCSLSDQAADAESDVGAGACGSRSTLTLAGRFHGEERSVGEQVRAQLLVEAGVWKLAGFTAVEGPTPIATDSLPADWDSFAVVAGWQPASGGEG